MIQKIHDIQSYLTFMSFRSHSESKVSKTYLDTLSFLKGKSSDIATGRLHKAQFIDYSIYGV